MNATKLKRRASSAHHYLHDRLIVKLRDELGREPTEEEIATDREEHEDRQRRKRTQAAAAAKTKEKEQKVQARAEAAAEAASKDNKYADSSAALSAAGRSGPKRMKHIELRCAESSRQ